MMRTANLMVFSGPKEAMREQAFALPELKEGEILVKNKFTTKGLFKYGHAQVQPQDIFHGGLAQYCVLKPGTAILKIPDTLPLPIAGFVFISSGYYFLFDSKRQAIRYRYKKSVSGIQRSRQNTLDGGEIIKTRNVLASHSNKF